MSKTIVGVVAQFFRRVALRQQGVRVFNNTVIGRGAYFKGVATIEPYCRIVPSPRMVFGKEFYLNAGCHLLGDIVIGDHVMIGPKTVIWGRDHGLQLGIPMQHQPHLVEKITIGDDVWIGANVTILKGVSIGNGAVVGAGAVVVKDVPAYSVVVGNPARVVKRRS